MTIVAQERMERLRKVQQLASSVHANRDRIERNNAAIVAATKDNDAARIALDSDIFRLHDEALKLGLATPRTASHLTDALVGLLVELPMLSRAPFITPCGTPSGPLGYDAKGQPAPSIMPAPDGL